MPHIYYLCQTHVNTGLLEVSLGGVYQYKEESEMANMKPFKNNGRDRKVDIQTSPLQECPKY